MLWKRPSGNGRPHSQQGSVPRATSHMARPQTACPPGLRPKASGSSVLTGRICTESSHTGHLRTRALSAGGQRPGTASLGRERWRGSETGAGAQGWMEQAQLQGGSGPGQQSYPRPQSPQPCPPLPTRPSSPPRPSRLHRDSQHAPSPPPYSICLGLRHPDPSTLALLTSSNAPSSGTGTDLCL